jgi:hypothetical protein|tara:strand:+ start:616 stop:813 length:198 start_codon:yes stop_codon:yes gene_type:complete
MKISTTPLPTRFLVCAFLTFGLLRDASASPLEGIWVNTNPDTNPDTNSVPQVEIQIDANGEARFT